LGDPWAPSLRVLGDGRVELYLANYEYDAANDINRADLLRFTQLSPTQFTFDGVALRHGDSLQDGDGRGIENVVIMPDAGGNGWRMLYGGGNETSGWELYGATSTDGINWKKDGPVIENGYPDVRPVGEGMVLDRLSDGTWRLLMGAYEPAPSSVNAWEITEWRSNDQHSWQFVRTIVSSTTMPPEARCAVYAPSLRQIGSSMWRMVFAGHSMCGTLQSEAIYSAISSDLVNWQFEGRLMGGDVNKLSYGAMANDFLYFIRQDNDGPPRLAVVHIDMQ